MSLTVPKELLEHAQNGGEVNDRDMLFVMQQSLPGGWSHIQKALGAYAVQRQPIACSVPEQDPELLRIMASTAMCGAIERLYQVEIDLVRGCKLVAGADVYPRRVSVRAELRALTGSPVSGLDEPWEVLQQRLPNTAKWLQQAVETQSEAVDYLDVTVTNEAERLQLLQILAASTLREWLESEFGGVQIGFLNCHRLVVADETVSSSVWGEATSNRRQIALQSPAMRDC